VSGHQPAMGRAVVRAPRRTHALQAANRYDGCNPLILTERFRARLDVGRMLAGW
jgi:hypothetical protein